MKTTKKLSTLILLSSLIWLSAMISCETVPPEGVAPMQNLPESEIIDSTSQSLAVSQSVENGDVWECKEKEISISKNSEDFVLYSADIIETVYPGNLLQGAPLQNGELKIIPLERGPGEITISLLDGEESRREVDEVSYGEVTEKINTLIGDNRTLAARLDFQKKVVRSQEEIGIALGLEFKKAGQGITSNLSFNKKVNYNYIFVKLTQVFYDVIYSIPTEFEDEFGRGVSNQDIREYIYPGNPATYISSVSYGRIFYLLVESTSTLEEMQVAVDATFAGNGAGLDVKHVKNLANSKVSGYALGGDADLAAGAAMGNIDRVDEFVRKGATVKTGFPISYKVRDLIDPAIEVKANVTTTYKVSECKNLSQGLPFFKDVYNRISAAAYFPFNGAKYKMALFGANTTTFKYIRPDGTIDVRGAIELSRLGQSNKHPFRNTGVKAVVWGEHAEKQYHFSDVEDKYVQYDAKTKEYGSLIPVKDWGGPNNHPFTSIAAACDGSVGGKPQVVFFSEDGGKYTIFDGDTKLFSNPQSIEFFNIRSSDEALAIPFQGVGAALRLYVNDEEGKASDRQVLAIFNGEGTKYVYYDIDKVKMIGPLDI